MLLSNSLYRVCKWLIEIHTVYILVVFLSIAKSELPTKVKSYVSAVLYNNYILYLRGFGITLVNHIVNALKC